MSRGKPTGKGAERDNPRLKGALNKNDGRADLDTAQSDSAFLQSEATLQVVSKAKDNHRIGELIDRIGSIQLADVASRSKNLLGREGKAEVGRMNYEG